ncbi:MAG: RDD family protein [Planctomycetaceae bacterium]|nr:RDD family protein [Planctomycetaceae bacterium]
MSDPQKRQVDTRVVVETPEGVDFQFIIAGPGTRFQAWLIDSLLKAGLIILTWLLLALMISLLFPNNSYRDFEDSLGAIQGLLIAAYFVLDWFYGSLFEGLMNGQTPGKKSAGLRVVRSNGTPVDLMSATGRNFLRTADMLPMFYLIGAMSMLFTRRLQRLGDLFFDTMVIDERREWIARRAGLTKDIEPIVRSECPRRFHVPERSLSVIERLFENDRIISDARREEIAKPLSEALRKRLGYQDPPPDPRNPHTYFSGQGLKHTKFLLRILKTFSTDLPAEKEQPRKGRKRSRKADRMTAADVTGAST